jgi:hypothetical protein
MCVSYNRGNLNYHSWEGARSDCYPEKNIVSQGEAEVDNVFFD